MRISRKRHLTLFLLIRAELVLFKATLWLFHHRCDSIQAIWQRGWRVGTIMVSDALLLRLEIPRTDRSHCHAGGWERRFIDEVLVADVRVSPHFGHGFLEVRHTSCLNFISPVDAIALIALFFS